VEAFMAVLVEGISVVIKRKSIDSKFLGGWSRFVADVPNQTLCADDDLARVGFMSPDDTEGYVAHLEGCGLCFVTEGQCVDFAVVDQLRGPTTPADWLEYTHLSITTGPDRKVAACWLFEGPRVVAGVHLSDNRLTLATPAGWQYENSLSARFTFVPDKEVPEKLKFLRHENGKDVYLDSSTGKEVYVGRANP
jgi:hypothetical protein